MLSNVNHVVFSRKTGHILKNCVLGSCLSMAPKKGFAMDHSLSLIG